MTSYTSLLPSSNENASRITKVTCPTCQGKGKLTQGQADNLVALIPARDKRLKPRRTKLYLGITIAIFTVSFFFIAFFLWPRAVNVSIIEAHTIKIHMPDYGTPYIDVEIMFQLTNENFFEARVTNLKTRVTWNQFILYTKTEDDAILIDGQSIKNHTVVTRELFSSELVSDKVKFLCIPGWKWSLFEKFDFSATISTILRSEQISDVYYGYMRCYNTTIGVK